MKKTLILVFLTLMLSLVAKAQEVVLECTYNSNQSYKVLLVVTADGGEAVSIGSGSRCHYDLKMETMGDHVVILAYNASLPNWVDDIYILSENKCFVVSPSMSRDNFAELKVETVSGATQIANKKREYGLTGGGGGIYSRDKSSNRL